MLRTKEEFSKAFVNKYQHDRQQPSFTARARGCTDYIVTYRFHDDCFRSQEMRSAPQPFPLCKNCLIFGHIYLWNIVTHKLQ
jgi:hypothetical protein